MLFANYARIIVIILDLCGENDAKFAYFLATYGVRAPMRNQVVCFHYALCACNWVQSV
jgi:hypothetical protein